MTISIAEEQENARNLYGNLRRSAAGSVVADFISKSVASSTLSFTTTSLERVNKYTLLILSAFLDKSVMQKIGFQNDILPPFILLASLPSRRALLHSTSPTLILEAVASSFSLLDDRRAETRAAVRSLIEELSDGSKHKASLILVLDQANSNQLQYWRLFTVRQSADGVIHDSERLLTSISSPSVHSSRSVFATNVPVKAEQLNMLTDELHAVRVLAENEQIEEAGPLASNGDDRRLRIANDTISALRIQVRNLDSEVADIKNNRDKAIANAVAVERDRSSEILNEQTGLLYAELDLYRTQCRFSSVQISVLDNEMRAVDCEIDSIGDSLSELRGKLLVAESDCTEAKKRAASVNKRNNELEKQFRSLQAKSLLDQQQIDELKSQNSAAKAELHLLKQKHESARSTSSEQIARLVDARLTAIEDAERARSQLTFASRRFRDHATQSARRSRRQVCYDFVQRLRLRVAKLRHAELQQKYDELASKPPPLPPEPPPPPPEPARHYDPDTVAKLCQFRAIVDSLKSSISDHIETLQDPTRAERVEKPTSPPLTDYSSNYYQATYAYHYSHSPQRFHSPVRYDQGHCY